jgi:hypothetical protein
MGAYTNSMQGVLHRFAGLPAVYTNSARRKALLLHQCCPTILEVHTYMAAGSCCCPQRGTHVVSSNLNGYAAAQHTWGKREETGGHMQHNQFVQL